MTSEPLPGGFVNVVVRPYVHDLLRHLEHYEWPGAPRYLGLDDEGREMLSFLPGHVAWEPAQPPDVWSEESLVRVARLVRQFHDLTAGTALAGAEEVACHHDLAPKNTVYRDDGDGLRPYAFIDWDLAAPGRRVQDVAHVCWQFLDLGPNRSSVEGPARLLRSVADAYGLARRDRAVLVETIMWWQDRCWRGIEDDPDAVEAVQDAYAWVAEHRAELHAAVN